MSSPDFKAVTPDADAFAQAVRDDPAGVLLAMDYDGTLADMVPDPDAAYINEQVARALADVAPRVGKFAIVTGRPVAVVRRLAALDRRPGLDDVTVLGQYGVERWDRATNAQRIPGNPPQLKTARKAVMQLLAKLAGEGRPVAGTYVEDKGRALGIHTRRADDPDGAMLALDDPVRDIAERHGLHVEPGKAVLELRAAGCSKADALRELGKEMHPHAVAFCGDDLGDVPAFELLAHLRQHGIVTCRVVSASSEQPELARYADVLAEGPVGIAAWLRSLRQQA